MSTSCAMSNVTSGFIDLATFDEIDKYLYGGEKAATYFVRETRKSTWFTQVPVQLTNTQGTGPTFGNRSSVHYEINRHGDYFLNSWVQITLPRVVAAQTTSSGMSSPSLCDRYIMWTPNLGHNLICHADVKFNDQSVSPNGGITPQYLDFWAAFTVPTDKAGAYNTMIGNTSDLCTPHSVLPEKTLYIPLPFFYTLDSGVALPMAALPYNVIKINVQYENFADLLLAVDCPSEGTDALIRNAVPSDYNYTDCCNTAQLWGTYALVSNDERQRMGCAPRDILIEQVQSINNGHAVTVTQDPSSATHEITFSHAVKGLMFGMSKTGGVATNLRSNYTTGDYYMGDKGGVYLANAPLNNSSLNGVYYGAGSPIETWSLLYENTNRLSHMGADYSELVNPYYSTTSVPGIVAPSTATPYYTVGMSNDGTRNFPPTTEGNVGINLYSYSLDFTSLDPMGSTNYGKLTHISLVTKFSRHAREYAATKGDNQTFSLNIIAVNNTILRIAGGAMGFAVI